MSIITGCPQGENWLYTCTLLLTRNQSRSAIGCRNQTKKWDESQALDNSFKCCYDVGSDEGAVFGSLITSASGSSKKEGI